MANRRDLKKHVNYISDIMVGLCIVESLNTENDDRRDAMRNLAEELINFRSDIISRISHTEPGNVKGFYKKLKSDFNAKIEEVFNKVKEQ